MPELKKDNRQRQQSLKLLCALVLCLLACPCAKGAPDKSLAEKLATVTDYVPAADAPLEGLIEVAQKFKLPMAVEWLREAKPTEKRLKAQRRSVKELLEELARTAPEHVVEVADGIVRVYSPQAAQHPFNFLNIRLDSYYVRDGDLFDAEDQLRWAIRFTLEPEKYRNGYGGGYGHPAGDVFEFPKFTLSATDITIRDALNRIALAQGNAMWVAEISREDLAASEPFWKRGADRDDEEGSGRSVTSAWHFYPLSEIPELAKEQLAVDVTVEGMLDERMSTIPVILEQGVAADSGGNMGIGSSEGYSIGYSAHVEKVEKDLVTLTVSLTVQPRGEPERKFTEQLQVRRGAVTELRPERGIRIRAYIEPRAAQTDQRLITQ